MKLARTATSSSEVMVALMLLAGGCASMGSLEPPDLNLVDLQLTDATLFETTLEAQIRISNPNPDPLTIAGASFKMVLNDRKLGRGLTSESVTIPRLTSEVVDVTFHVNNATAILRLKEILEQQSVDYTVTGKVYVESSFGTRKVKVESQGRFDLNESNPAGSDTEE